MYEEKNFDEWLDESVKQEILRELKEKWDDTTDNQCVFVSAVEKKNIDALREMILGKVRDMYKVRYPYRTIEY